MYIYTLLDTLVWIACVIAIIYIAYRIFAWRQGNEDIIIMVKRRTPFVVEDISFDQVVLSTDIPFVNRGKQYGTIMDMFPRHLLPQEQFDNVQIQSWLTDAKAERHDGYWEALVYKQRQGGTIRVRVVMTANSGNIRKDLVGFPDMPIDIYNQVVGREAYRISKTRITLTAEELEVAMRK